MMRITCPTCTTSYTIADDKIGAKGRSVRCASCGEKWHVSLDHEQVPTVEFEAGGMAADHEVFDIPARSPDTARSSSQNEATQTNTLPKSGIESATSALAQPDGATQSDTQTPSGIDLDTELQIINKRKDIESYAKKPKIKVSKKKPPKVRKPFKFDMDRFLVQARPAFGALVLLAAIVVVVLAVTLRVSIVAAFPSLASLYDAAGLPVNLRGLTIDHLQMLREVENGQPVLVVEGELTNPTSVDRPVPAVRFALRGDDAQEIYAWSIEPKSTLLTAGATLRFRTRLASPPEQSADIQVRMINRRDQQAALHD